jgi:hypothetical protein
MANPQVEARIEGLIRVRGTDYEYFIERRRERERVRKRVWRKQQTPGQRERECDRKREVRKQQTPEQCECEKQRERKRDRKKLRPYLGVDGEGGGTDALERQNYFLMCASGQTSEEEY